MVGLGELVSALGRRDGVSAAMIVARDGLLIDGTSRGREADRLAALVPSLLQAAAELARVAGQGALGQMVLDHDTGTIVVQPLSTEAFLLVVVHPTANLAALLYDLRRHRAQLAALG